MSYEPWRVENVLCAGMRDSQNVGSRQCDAGRFLGLSAAKVRRSSEARLCTANAEGVLVCCSKSCRCQVKSVKVQVDYLHQTTDGTLTSRCPHTE